jgi:hypothetical protein
MYIEDVARDSLSYVFIYGSMPSSKPILVIVLFTWQI